MNLFCGLMELSGGFNITVFYEILENIKLAVKSVFGLVQRKAIDEEKNLNAKKKFGENLPVSGDGFGQKEALLLLLAWYHLLESIAKKSWT